MWKYYVPKGLNLESVILLNCIVGSCTSMSENEGGLWTLQVTGREFDGLIVCVYCQVRKEEKKKLSGQTCHKG